MKKAVRAIVIKGDCLLVIKRNKFGTKYNTLVGGAVEMGEELETAVLRELKEETGIVVSDPKLVYIEEPGPPYGTQYIFKCEYVSGEPTLSSEAPESYINKLGQNLYEPAWVKLEDLRGGSFKSPQLLEEIFRAVREGFPDKPMLIKG